MTRDEVKEKILTIVREQLNPEDEIKESDSFRPDLNADSLDAAEMIMTIEEKFDLIIPDQDANGLKTIGLTIDYVYRRLNP